MKGRRKEGWTAYMKEGGKAQDGQECTKEGRKEKRGNYSEGRRDYMKVGRKVGRADCIKEEGKTRDGSVEGKGWCTLFLEIHHRRLRGICGWVGRKEVKGRKDMN